jgi:hypothetical protein
MGMGGTHGGTHGGVHGGTHGGTHSGRSLLLGEGKSDREGGGRGEGGLQKGFHGLDDLEEPGPVVGLLLEGLEGGPEVGPAVT